MDSRYAPLILGGLVPALLYGLAGVLQKGSARAGGTVSIYLIVFGVATVVTGLTYRVLLADPSSPTRSILPALAAGLAFGAGAGLISFSIIRYNAPVSQLAPIYNMNLLVTVALGLVVFSEYRDVQATRLLLGAVLVLAGGWLAASA
jgi:uncharacterized membrane protein